MNDLEEKIKQLRIEDFIWLIYIGIILMSWYANSLEGNYFKNRDLNSKEKYRSVMVFIFSILLIVYFYFMNSSYNDLKKVDKFTPKKCKTLSSLSFLASLLIFISGIIFLYIAIVDEDLYVELAFS